MLSFVLRIYLFISLLFFFFNDTATTEIYTLSLHDALPIYYQSDLVVIGHQPHHNAKTFKGFYPSNESRYIRDRKSTRLNSSHQIISYAVFCLKKKKYKYFTKKTTCQQHKT